MLTKLTIRNFKLFDEVEIELSDRVVFVGPNNSGKTSALQALALWNVGAKRWVEKRGLGDVPEKRPGVTINRKDLITVPVPAANLLWRDLHTQQSKQKGGTDKIFIEVVVEGVSEGKAWKSGLGFYYANEESFYCRTLRLPDGRRMEVPSQAANLRLAYLPPMSGLAATRVTESYKTGVFRKPKGAKSRFVDVPDFLMELIKAHVAELRKGQLKHSVGGLVDLLILDPERNSTPLPYSQREVQAALRRSCKIAGLAPRNPHDLRHTYATTLLIAGVSPAYVQKQLGHSSISMTVDIYGHWVPGEGRAGLEAALMGGSSADYTQKVVRNLRIIAYKNERASVSN